MTIDVHPEALRTLGRVWEQAACAMPAQAQTLDGVGHGSDNFGRINRFLTPAVSLFVWQARELAQGCGELLEQGVSALCATARDLEETDDLVARLLAGDTEEIQQWVWA